ncbi:MAG: energy-coupling factor transporter transmembrane component T family protein [Anaerolineae bacterium]
MRLDLDPRTRLAMTVLYAALIVATGRIAWLAVELGVLLVLVLVTREGRAYLRWLRLVAVMAVAWFAVSLWAFDLPTAVNASLRLMALTSAFFLLFRTMMPQDLGNALVKSGLPYEIAFVLSTSLQFVPVMGRKVQNVVDAQRSRGIPLEPGLRALRFYPALMAPLLVQAFQLADELAEAMEARGFGRKGRTFARDYRLQRVDWAALLGMAALLGVVIWMR